MKRFLTLFAVFSILLAGCGAQAVAGSEATPTPYPTPVKETFTVQRGNISVDAKLSGRVSPLALQTVFFQMDGQVREVYANVNDKVTEGQLLGELAEAQELRAKADETQRTIRRAQIDLEIAQLTLEQYKSQGRTPNEIKIQELQVELAQMKLDETLQSLGIDPNAPVTDELDADAAAVQFFHFAVEHMQEEFHQCADFFRRTIPVFTGKCEQGQAGDSALDAEFHADANRFRAGTMAEATGTMTTFGPATIAVHDDGKMFRKFS